MPRPQCTSAALLVLLAASLLPASLAMRRKATEAINADMNAKLGAQAVDAAASAQRATDASASVRSAAAVSKGSDARADPVGISDWEHVNDEKKLADAMANAILPSAGYSEADKMAWMKWLSSLSPWPAPSWNSVWYPYQAFTGMQYPGDSSKTA